MGSQPSPPTLDTNQSKALTQADYTLKIQNTPALTEAVGKAGREEYSRNLAYALQGFTDPASIVYAGQIEDATEKLTKSKARLEELTGARTKGDLRYVDGKWMGASDYKKLVDQQRAGIKSAQKEINKYKSSDPVKQLKDEFKDQFAQSDRLLAQMERDQRTSGEFNRFQRALGEGVDARTINAARANTARGQAAGMGRVADVQAKGINQSRMGDFGAAESNRIRAGQVGAGALGQSLMSQAMQRAQSDGRLSAQAERDAVQAARQSMAARGMATSGAGTAAELLNRDRYARQRQMEDLNFAQGVQAQDLGRQFQNVGNQLSADQSNQSAQMQAELANLQARYNAAVQAGDWEMAARTQNQQATMQARLANQQTEFGRQQIISGNQQQANMANMQAANQMNQFNAGLLQDARQFNANARFTADQQNIGYLGQAAMNVESERQRQLGLAQNRYNFGVQTDPKMMLAGLGSPYANFTPQALGLMNSTNVQPIYSGGSAGTYGTNMALLGSLLGGGMQAAGLAYGRGA